MGVRAGLTVVTPAELQEIMDGGNPDLKGAQHYHLDKAWSGIHDLLLDADEPLALAMVPTGCHRWALEM